jgi:hypothetical protein
MESKEKKLTLFLLCGIFGLLGAHRFYTGKYITGVLQPLLPCALFAMWLLLVYFDIYPPKPFTAFMLFSAPIWVVIDLVRIIIGNFTDREGNRITEWI